MSLFGSTKQTQRVILSPEQELERLGRTTQEQTLPELQSLVAEGAGTGDVARGAQSQRSLADLLQQYASGGFLPNQSDLSTARSFAGDIFAGQQEALNQSFEDAQTQAARQAAALGRPVNDPILQAKLAQGQAREQSLLSAQQRGFAAEQAMNMPLQRLQFAQMGAETSQALAAQALQNRQALLQTGQGIQDRQQAFRLATATRENTQSSDPGLAGIAGMAMGGLGAFAGLGGVSGIAGLFSGAKPSINTPPIAPTASAGGIGGMQQMASSVPSFLNPATQNVTPQDLSNFFAPSTGRDLFANFFPTPGALGPATPRPSTNSSAGVPAYLRPNAPQSTTAANFFSNPFGFGGGF